MPTNPVPFGASDNRIAFRATPVDFATIADIQQHVLSPLGHPTLSVSAAIRLALQVTLRAIREGKLEELTATPRRP